MNDYQTLAIPASLRLKIYILFTFLGLALSGTEVGYSTANVTQPLWLKIALAVFGFLSVAVGFTAASHTPNVGSGSNPVVDPPTTLPPAATPFGSVPVTNSAPLTLPVNPIPPGTTVNVPTSATEGGFAALGFIGVVLLLVGLLSIVGLFHLAFAISVVLLVIGILLVFADWRGTRVL